LRFTYDQNLRETVLEPADAGLLPVAPVKVCTDGTVA
jgi:hypothetical protein